MPDVYPSSGAALNFEYPLRDSKLSCTSYEFNITYVMPEVYNDRGHIILTQVVQSGFLVITTYCYPEKFRSVNLPSELENKFVRFYVLDNDKAHCLAMHKRENPFSIHEHIGLTMHSVAELERLRELLYHVFMPMQRLQPAGFASSISKPVNQLLYSVRYLVNHPEEPGINFENGHYALRDGYNPDSVYFRGPYKLVDRKLK